MNNRIAISISEEPLNENFVTEDDPFAFVGSCIGSVWALELEQECGGKREPEEMSGPAIGRAAVHS